MTHDPKIFVVERDGRWWTLVMLYTYHGALVAERFLVGMN